jgi:uncharacterized protein
MKEYLPRIADKELALRLESFGATLIVGPKWCGKTTTAEQQAKSILRMQDPDMKSAYIASAKVKPSLLLNGDKPRLLDEWQDAPELWDSVRTAVDKENKVGQYILTGSNSVDSKKVMHSGIGRISRMKMYPMSLYESLESNGKVSLKELFNNPNYEIDGIESELSVEDLIFATCRGGWPSSLSKKNKETQLIVTADYLDGICETEISSVDGIRRDPAKTRILLRSYARNISTIAKNSTLISDINSKLENISNSTFDSYITALERLFIIEDIPAWCPAIRSASAIRCGYKREFVDPSIGVAALGVGPNYFETDLKTFGFFFENLCSRDLKIYSQALKGELSYYLDRYGLEADFVLHLKDGKYALIECKLGSQEIEEGVSHLLKIKDLISKANETEKQCPLREPDLMIVLTGGQMAYRQNDGVYIIPIGCLKD